jgi:hypothetical protein
VLLVKYFFVFKNKSSIIYIMEHQKNPKDINTNNDNQGENIASSSNTNTTISEQEISETGKRIIKVINEVVSNSNQARGSWRKVEDIFLTGKEAAMRRFGEPEYQGENVGLFSKNRNSLYYMNEKDKGELAEKYTGLDRIIVDRLIAKVGTRQSSSASLTVEKVIGAIPIISNFGTPAMLASLDNAKIELEKSFSIAEVKEIVKESREADYQQLEIIEN